MSSNGKSQTTSSVNSDKSDSDNENVEKQFNRIEQFKMILNIIQKTFFLFGLTFFSFAYFLNSTTKVSQSPAAYPFFERNSLITDWFEGDLTNALHACNQHDVCILMYYAPWDAQCQNIRKELLIVAEFFQKQINVMAINCWQPGSECSRHRAQSGGGGSLWPGMAVHIGREVVIYHGPYQSDYMIHFLSKLMKPFERITKKKYLTRLYAISDLVLLGVVNTLKQYKIYYRTALSIIEKYPFADICMAVLINSTNKHAAPSLKAYTPKKIITYTGNWSVNNIMESMPFNGLIFNTTQWFKPREIGKNIDFLKLIKKGPTLVIFTPRNLLFNFNPLRDYLRIVNLFSNRCNYTMLYDQFLKNVIAKFKNEEKIIKNLLNSCQAKEKNYCNNLNTNVWISHSSNSCLDTTFHKKISQMDLVCDNACNEKNFCEKSNLNSYNLKLNQIYFDKHDRFTSDNLVQYHNVQKCRLLKKTMNDYYNTYGELLLDVLNTTTTMSLLNNDLNQISCNYNRTIKMIIIDTKHYADFAQILGVDLKQSKSNAVIIDKRNEMHYKLDEIVNIDNLSKFLIKFMKNELEMKYHKQIFDNHYRLDYFKIVSSCDQQQNTSICIKELDSDNFLPTVLNDKALSVVLFYGNKCGFCQDASRILLHTMDKLQILNRTVRFYRIDVETNPLPWSYNVYKLPTIIIFPIKKDESSVYPLDAIRTVPNLIKFIQKHLPLAKKLQLGWSICSNREKCLIKLRRRTKRLYLLTLKQLRIRRMSNYLNELLNLEKLAKLLRKLYWLFGYKLSKFEFYDNLDLNIEKTLFMIERVYLDLDDSVS